MKPFRLNIIGNICSGKTELIELIKKDFGNAKYFSIDEYRKKYGSFDAKSDTLVWERLIEDCVELPFSVVESSGTSIHFKHIRAMATTRTITILIKCPIDICLERYKNRPISNFQIARKFKIEESLEYMENKLSITNSDWMINGTLKTEILYEKLMQVKLWRSFQTIAEIMKEHNELNNKRLNF